MGYISFNPTDELMVLRLTVGGLNRNSFRNVIVALDTGASDTSIPTKVASDLGYDLSNPKHLVRLTTGSSTVPAKIITVRKLTAIGETVENIDVLCHDLPEESTIDGVLGLNFLRHFDLNISFSTGIIELQPY
ncbi:MAG: retropepsin-like aspartic protease [Candidatus Poribacteria bacterium]|nr:retropepsin-like aspartic protease [Candidatus Poribacteria bacterium]